MIVKYAFEKLNLNKINLGVVAYNQKATDIYEKVGFKVEGRIRQNFYHDGKYFDSIVMGILAKEYFEKWEGG